MSKPVKLSEARSKMTRLELITNTDRYDEVLKSIEALPEPKGKKQAIAQAYKTFLYEKGMSASIVR